MEVKVKFLCDGPQKLYKSSPNAVGYELFSTECFELLPNEIRKLPTGVILELPDSLYVQVAEKSSVSLCGLRVLAGIIDPDYRAQIFVVLHNITNQKISWDKTKPIAQLIFHSTINPCFVYLGFYVAFNTVQVISRRVVGRAEETSTYSSLGFCTVNCRPTASTLTLAS